jgi:hypothetical protein
MPAIKINFKLVFMASATFLPKLRPGRTIQSQNCRLSAEPQMKNWFIIYFTRIY